MDADRNKQIENAIDKTLIALENGGIKTNEANNEILRLQNVINSDIQDDTDTIQKRKTPLSRSISKDEKLLGEAQKTRAYSLLNADLSVIKNELQKAANTKDYDFLFTVADCIYSDKRFKDAEKYSIDRIYQQAIKDTRILDLVDNKMKLNYLKRETDYILSKIGSIDNADLRRNAQFERARFDIAFTKIKTDRETQPFAEFIKDIQ